MAQVSGKLLDTANLIADLLPQMSPRSNGPNLEG